MSRPRNLPSVEDPKFKTQVENFCKFLGIDAKLTDDQLRKIHSIFSRDFLKVQEVTAKNNEFFNNHEALLLSKMKEEDALRFARETLVEFIIRFETDMYLIKALNQAGVINDFTAASEKYVDKFAKVYVSDFYATKIAEEFSDIEAPIKLGLFSNTKTEVKPEMINSFRKAIGLGEVEPATIKKIIAGCQSIEKPFDTFEAYWAQIVPALNLQSMANPDVIFAERFREIKNTFEADMKLIQAMRVAGTIQDNEFENCKQMYVDNYKQTLLLLKDILVEIKKIEVDGGYNKSRDEWTDLTSRYPQKHAVLNTLVDYLLDKKDAGTLTRVMAANPKYKKSLTGKSSTETLIDRVLKHKEYVEHEATYKPHKKELGEPEASKELVTPTKHKTGPS